MTGRAAVSHDLPTAHPGDSPQAAAAVVALPVLVARLSRSLLVSAMAGGCGIVGLFLVYFLLLPSLWLLVLLTVAALHQGAVAIILVICGGGRVARAAVLFCLTDWAVVLVALIITPVCAPALVPIIIARIVSTLPYLGRRPLLRLVVASVILGVIVGVLSQVDLLGVDDEVPGWVVLAFVVFFVPVGIGIVGLDLWQHSATLLETARQALDANAALRASERALAEQAEEIRLSRARLVAAADVERRRIERDLHDGVQQTLVGLCLGVSLLAERQVEGSPLRTQLSSLESAAEEAVVELRGIAHGVYPPILASHGLAAALRAVLRRFSRPVRARIEAVERRSPGQESAAYFCCREALQNAEKHAGPAARIAVTLREADGNLHFSVVDTGRGFDAVKVGHGLVNMRDRLAAVGGTLTVQSSPGGTRVAGAIPPAETEEGVGQDVVTGGHA